jgi:hypothetical protein
MHRNQLMRITLAVQQNRCDEPFPTSQVGIDLEAGPDAFKATQVELWDKLNGSQSREKFHSDQVGIYRLIFGPSTLQLPSALAEEHCPQLAAVARRGDVRKDAEAEYLGIGIELLHDTYMRFFSYLMKHGEALWFENMTEQQKWTMLRVLHPYLPDSKVTKVLFDNLQLHYVPHINEANAEKVIAFAEPAGARILHLAAFDVLRATRES